ncbi:hypothetical protein ACFV29_18360 [Streptomyces sp. NPDC059690]|uniref:hypothetical protein n=1 Tax=Streptomyces sp. NPDC059690 TaxID=3346907 RepID=UPI0036A5EDA5
MGIESDKVVYEYLSRVGDVAQQRQLPSAARMRLVSELRNEIDRRRAKATVDSPAAVRRIINRLGSPDEVVEAAGGGPAAAGAATPTQVPVQRDDETAGEEPRKGLRRVVPRPRPSGPVPLDKPSAPSDAPSPPHLAGAHELGGSATRPDWWRVDSARFGDSLPPGFTGGVEIPDLLRAPRPQEEREPAAEKAEKAAEAVAEAVPEAGAPAARRRLLPLPSGRWSNPLLLIAAALLVAGAVLGNWFALLLGWLIAYASRRLTQNESKWAVVGMPGLAVTAGVVWLWGRNDGRWGDPIARGHMNDAISQTWPWVVRGAAVLSALYVVWRSQRKA